MISLKCAILKKNDTNELIYKTEIDSQIQKTILRLFTKGDSGGSVSSVQSLSRIRLFATP